MNGTLRYADLSAVEYGGYSLGASPIVVPQEVIDPDADGSEPVLDQDSTLAASDGARAPPVSKVPYVPRWTSTHAPSEAAAAKWQSLAQKWQFTEVHMPDGCFVPMEGQPSGNVRRSPDYATKCSEGTKLPPPGSKVTEEHRAEYPDLRDEEIRAIGRVIVEKSEALWI